jgi:hypothetical protein
MRASIAEDALRERMHVAKPTVTARRVALRGNRV